MLDPISDFIVDLILFRWIWGDDDRSALKTILEIVVLLLIVLFIVGLFLGWWW